MTMTTAIKTTLARWNSEAEVNFVRRLKTGEQMHRELWANGAIMVGHEGARANQMVPLGRAIEIYREWKATGKITVNA